MKRLMLLTLILGGCGGSTNQNAPASGQSDPSRINLSQVSFDGVPKSTFLSTASLFQVNQLGTVSSTELKDSNSKKVSPEILFQFKLDATHTAMRYSQPDGGSSDVIVNLTTGKTIDCSDYDLTYAQLFGNTLFTYSKVKASTLYKVNLVDMSRAALNRNDSNDDPDEEGSESDKSQTKQLLCQTPTTNPHTISVDQNAVQAHLKKGATLGACNGDTTVGANFYVTYDEGHMDLHAQQFNAYAFLVDQNQSTITRVPGALEDFFSALFSPFTHHTEVGQACQTALCKREILALPNQKLGAFTWFQDVNASNTEIAVLQLAQMTPAGANADKGIYNEGTTVSQMPLGTLHPVPTNSSYRLSDTERFVIFEEGFYHIYVNAGGSLQADFFWLAMPNFANTPTISGSNLYWMDATHVYRKNLEMLVNTPQQGGFYTESSATEVMVTDPSLQSFSVLNGTVMITTSHGTKTVNNPADSESDVSDSDLDANDVMEF